MNREKWNLILVGIAGLFFIGVGLAYGATMGWIFGIIIMIFVIFDWIDA